jgi:uncharacterized membrane protein YeiB
MTGAVLAWMKHVLVPEDPWAVIHHPLQPLVLKLHIIVAPLLVFVLGMVATRHVWSRYHAKETRGRRTGLVTAALIVPMILSGYLIQVFTSELLLQVTIVIHIAAGSLYVAGLALHMVLARQRDASQVRSRHSGLSELETAVEGMPSRE